MPKQALIFVEGIYNFRFLRFVIPNFAYFHKLDTLSKSTSFAVYFPVSQNGDTVKRRAQSLADFFKNVPERDIHIIAHSMGGLDARYCIQNLDVNHRVRSLTTIATPHRGTLAADWALDGKGVLPWLVRRALMPGLRDTSTKACAAFNEATPDREDVLYRSVVGHRPTRDMPLPYKFMTRFLSQREGENDSVVSIRSGSWGQETQIVSADHTELVGWSLGFADKTKARPFDHVSMYASIIKDLQIRALSSDSHEKPTK